MSRSERQRARFAPTDLVEHWRGVGINHRAHRNTHAEQILVYTTAPDLDLVAGTAFYAPVSGQINWVRVSVTGAPSGGALVVDVLLDAVSIFDGSNYASVPDGTHWGYKQIPDTRNVIGMDVPANAPTPITVQATTLNAATGPMVVYIGMAPRIN